MEADSVARGVKLESPKEHPIQPPEVKEEEKQRSELEERRKILCSEFAAITSSDMAVAQCYLAENDWDMQVSPGFREDVSQVPPALREVLA